MQKPYRKAGINFEFKIYREEFDVWLLDGAEDLLDRGYEIFNLKLSKKHAKSKLVRIDEFSSTRTMAKNTATASRR